MPSFAKNIKSFHAQIFRKFRRWGKQRLEEQTPRPP